MPETPTALPDYSGGSLVNLMASLIRGLGGDSPYPGTPTLSEERVAAARTVTLLVIDGLGWEALAAHPESTLARLRPTRLTSVFPTTTTSAITSLTTGLPPAAHGLPAWYTWLRELDRVAIPLIGRARKGSDYDGEPLPDLAALYPAPPLTAGLSHGIASRHLQPNWIVDSAYSHHHGGPAERHGFDGLEELIGQTVAGARLPGRRYQFVYWAEYDHLCHEHGTRGAATEAHFHAIDAAVGRLCAELPDDALLLVTADHGLVDVAPGGCHQLMDHPRLAATLSRPLCGEPRAPFLYLKPGREADADACLTETFAELCTVHTREQVLDEGWLGPGPLHPELASRIGDRILSMAPGQVLVGDGDRPGHCQRGVHGGLDPAELGVPLAVVGP